MPRNYVQGQDYRLAGAGVAATDTSIVLTSMTLPNSEALVTMADFGDIGFVTLEPETNREENCSFTGITQNANGTATLTGVTRGLTFVSPSGVDVTLRRSHSGGSLIRVSNSVQFYEILANRYNTQSIFEVWSFTAGKNPKYLTQPASFGDLDLINKAFLATGVYDYFVDTGAADAIVITPTTALAAYVEGNRYFIKVAASNTGATTINVNGLGVKSLKKNVTDDLQAGDLLADQIILAVYDGTNFQLIGGTGSSSSSSVGSNGNLAEQFDDFINWVETVDGTGSKIFVSGNFYMGDTSNVLSTATDHQGIVTITTVGGGAADVLGFIAGQQADTGDGGPGLIPVGNDFKFTFHGKSTRTGAAFDTAIGLTDDSSQYDVYVRFNNIQSATKVAYYNGAGPVVSSIDLPTSGDWFTLIFDYVALTNTLTIKLDGQTVFSGPAVFTDTQVGFRFGNVSGTAGTTLAADYVRTVPRIIGGGVQSKTITLSAAEITTLNASPYELVAAPGAGQAVVLRSFIYSFVPGATQYTAGNSVRVIYSTTTGNSLIDPISAGVITSASASAAIKAVPFGNDDPIVTNDALQLYNIGAEFATGDGTLELIFEYQTIDL